MEVSRFESLRSFGPLLPEAGTFGRENGGMGLMAICALCGLNSHLSGASYVADLNLGESDSSKLPLFPSNRGWSSTQKLGLYTQILGFVYPIFKS